MLKITYNILKQNFLYAIHLLNIKVNMNSLNIIYKTLYLKILNNSISIFLTFKNIFPLFFIHVCSLSIENIKYFLYYRLLLIVSLQCRISIII